MSDEIILNPSKDKFLSSDNFLFELPTKYKDLKSENVLKAIKVFSIYSSLESGSIFKKGEALYNIKNDVEIKDWLDFANEAFHISRTSAYNFVNYYLEFKNKQSEIISYSSWLAKKKGDRMRLARKNISKGRTKKQLRILVDKLTLEVKKLSKELDNKVINAVEVKSMSAEEFVDNLKEDLNESLKEIENDGGKQYLSNVEKLLELVEKSWNLKKQTQRVNFKLKEYGVSEEVKKLSVSISLKIDELHNRMFRKK